MKNLLFLFIFISQFACGQVALDSMLTACYPFTGNADDLSGNNHHGTVFGATLTADRFGNLNSAYHFDGFSSYIEVQRFDSLIPTDEISVSFWCRVRTFASHAQFQLQPDDAADRFNISVHYSHNGVPSTFWDYGSIFTTGRYDTIDIPFVTQWEHYVFISSASQDFMSEYKDGVLVKYINQHEVIANKVKPFWIGKGSTLACLDGEIDDIRFYNRVLNDSEIVTLYNSPDVCNIMPPVAAFTANDTTICQSECINFNNISVNATSYQWFFTGGAPSVSIDANPQSICYNISGNFDVTLIATNGSSSDTLTFSNYISVLSYFPQSISQNGDTLVSLQGFLSYQWYYNGNIISGATNYFYVALQSGDYNVVSVDEYGCQVEAVVFNVVATVNDNLNMNDELLNIYPNPASDVIVINWGNAVSISKIVLYNVMGEIRLTIYPENNLPGQPVGRSIKADVSNLSSGIYVVEIRCGSNLIRKKILKSVLH